MRLTTEQKADRQQKRAERKAQWAEVEKRIAENHATMRAHIARGTCPDCGGALRRNTSLTGWWQCEQFGAAGFRKDPTRPSCGFQGFAE